MIISDIELFVHRFSIIPYPSDIKRDREKDNSCVLKVKYWYQLQLYCQNRSKTKIYNFIYQKPLMPTLKQSFSYNKLHFEFLSHTQ